MTEREKFEACIKPKYDNDLGHQSVDGSYKFKPVQVAWEIWQAATASTQEQMAALAAENSALKAISDDRRAFIMNGVQLGYIKVPTVETDPALETIRIAVSPQEQTPATDAFKADQQAIGVEKFAKNENISGDQYLIKGNIDLSLRFRQSAKRAEDFAQQLRDEVKS